VLFVATENVALGKLAVQSSNVTKSPASLAVDGDMETTSCTETSLEPWWSVDLGEPMTVDHVIVTNDKNVTSGELLIRSFTSLYDYLPLP